jgi:tRNA splicing endonuclease
MSDHEAVAGTLVARHGAVVHVLGGPSICELHSWPAGGFGELLYEPPTRSSTTSPKEHAAAEAAARAPEACVLQLSSAEAYYLAFLCTPARLMIHDAVAEPEDGEAASDGGGLLGHSMTRPECWEAFCLADPLFPQLCAAYQALRSVGWWIRDGVKFGVDFTLYEGSKGPAAHATHSVLIVTSRECDWLWLQNHLRLSHTVSKELLLCYVSSRESATASTTTGIDRGPAEQSERSPPGLETFTVSTVHVKSWSANREHGLLSQ